MKRTPKIWISLWVSMVAWALTGHAAVLVYSVVANNGGSYYASEDTGSFALDQFDNSLGTLDNVVLRVTGFSHNGFIWVDNEWTSAGKIQLEIGSYMELSGPGSMLLSFAPTWTTSLSTLAADNAGDGGGTAFTGTDSLRLTGTALTELQSHDPFDFTPYIGTGQITYSFWGESHVLAFPLDPLDVPGRLAEQSALPFYSFSAEITYEYTARGEGEGEGGNVPEPGTLGMGLALAGLSLSTWVRRRMAQWRDRGASPDSTERTR